MKKIFLSILFLLFVFTGCFPENNVPKSLEQLEGEDGSVWERVSVAGFGDKYNVSVVAMTPFQGSLYAITRNDVSGFELWHTKGESWEKVSAPGFTNGIFHEFMHNIWGDMIEFKEHLYVAVSSGFQGANRYKSVGCEIWRFDGEDWEPVISHLLADKSEEGIIDEIFGCSLDDDHETADFTDYAKDWDENEWAGGTLWITDEKSDSKGRVFRIISNTENTLTVQQSECAAAKLDRTPDYFNEYTRCDEFFVPGEPGRPGYTVPALLAGLEYFIMTGDRINGFGDFWNKTIVDFEILDNELYASIGLNYESGTHIMKTSDGINWEKSSKRSFGLFHGYDWNLNLHGCLISSQEYRNGSPVCSSSNKFGKSTITGEETLFVGGTGSTGCNGIGARVFKLDSGDWSPIIDYFVDENTTGTNENGFGDGSTNFFESNFQAWDWAEYDGKLFTSIARILDGGRIMFTETGSENDFQDDGITPTWQYNVGGDSDVPGGFGMNKGYASIICMNLYTFGNSMYAGTYQNNVEFGKKVDEIEGAHLWKMTGKDGVYTWSPVFQNGFGDKTILQIEAFTEFEDKLYVAASNLLPSNYWPEDEREEGYLGAKIYRLAKE